MSTSPIIVWLRNDLRLHDNHALFAASITGSPVIVVYIVDEKQETPFPLGSASKWWLHHSLKAFSESIGNKLIIRKGDPKQVLDDIIRKTHAKTLFWNRRYTPHQIAYDTQYKSHFQSQGIEVKSYKGNILVEPWELYNKQGKPFQVFTPFYKASKEQFTIEKPQATPSLKHFEKPIESLQIDTLGLLPTLGWDAGFYKEWQPGEKGALDKLVTFTKKAFDYSSLRDFPDKDNTSKLSAHLHFGEISPRCIAAEIENSEPYIRQLYWRDFAHYLTYHFPHTVQEPLQEKFKTFPWRDNHAHLKAWQKGLTGYPIVDAGMRELWQTGWMHNRVRMIVGSFLVKDLLISWKEGFSWFWDTLVDADIPNNTLGWQWVSGCGADAAPYFRIFNPITQGEKFDPEGHYIRRFVPELTHMPNTYIHKPWCASESLLRQSGVSLGKTYPHPIVDHDRARIEALDALKTISKNENG